LCSAHYDGIFLAGAESGDLQVWQRDATADQESRQIPKIPDGAPRCSKGHVCLPIVPPGAALGPSMQGWRCGCCGAKRGCDQWHCGACQETLCYGCFPRHVAGERKDLSDAEFIQGRWVSVKKHSAMGCAVSTFRDEEHCDAVLDRFAQKMLNIGGIQVEVKAHREKQADGTRSLVPSCAFAGWKQPKLENACRLLATTLQAHLDLICDRCCPVIELDN